MEPVELMIIVIRCELMCQSNVSQPLVVEKRLSDETERDRTFGVGNEICSELIHHQRRLRLFTRIGAGEEESGGCSVLSGVSIDF